MIKPNSNELVEISSTIDQDPLIDKLNDEILKISEKLRIKAYNDKYNDGILRYISIRVNEKKEAMVTFIVTKDDKDIRTLAKETSKLQSVISVYLNINDKKDPGLLFGDKTILLEGKECIILELDKIKYQVYPKTFFQLNTLQAKNMFDLIKKACKLSFKERVLDAYCGVGAISLYLAHNAKEVVGIEYNKDSIEAAKANAKLNKISNATFIQGDAGEVMLKEINNGNTFDVIVVDPPRQGLDDKFIDAILKSKVKRVIYASCNPQTLAKNLKRLTEKYMVNSITPLDMFPNTPLVESVTTLTLKK
jgi:23S rRNA (uracil1939-C5)-methyltransferase